MTYHFSPSGVPPHRLIVENGVPVMMIRNTFFQSLFNGKMFIVKGFTRRALKLGFVGDRGREEDIFVVPQVTFKFRFHGIHVSGRQFPVRVAFARNVHKAHYQTLKREMVDFRCPCFLPVNCMSLFPG